jgi:hypothetical protein
MGARTGKREKRIFSGLQKQLLAAKKQSKNGMGVFCSNYKSYHYVVLYHNYVIFTVPARLP